MDKITKNLSKIAVILSILGIGSLVILIISDLAYPSLAFRILAPVGVFSVILAAICYVADYLVMFYKAAKSKDYYQVLGLILVGFILLIIFALR